MCYSYAYQCVHGMKIFTCCMHKLVTVNTCTHVQFTKCNVACIVYENSTIQYGVFMKNMVGES